MAQFQKVNIELEPRACWSANINEPHVGFWQQSPFDAQNLKTFQKHYETKEINWLKRWLETFSNCYVNRKNKTFVVIWKLDSKWQSKLKWNLKRLLW